MFKISLNWIQILGIENLEAHTIQQRKQELKDVVKKYKPMFVQLGSIDVLSVTSRKQLQDPVIVQEVKTIRDQKIANLEKEGFTHSGKENLPPSTYLIDLQQDEKSLIQAFGSQHTQKLKKAIKNKIQVTKASSSDYAEFFNIFIETAAEKGFSIISENTYYKLAQRLEDNQAGGIYIARNNNIISAGAVYLIDKETQTGIYLYGATNRGLDDVGASQLLHLETWKMLQAENIHTIDLLGGSPTGDLKHRLYSVDVFKAGFGGKKFDFLGSFDIVYKPFLYKIWFWLRKLHA